MHTLGKVFLGLTLLCAIGAVVLTTQLLNIRNSWMRRIAQSEATIEQNDAQLDSKQQELESLRLDLDRMRLTWDGLAAAQTAQVDNLGRVNVSVGPTQGFATVEAGQAAPMVQAFAEAPGGAVYIGPFRVASAQGSQSVMEPVFTVLPGDPQSWPTSNWHLWQSIPSEAPSRVVALTNKIVAKSEIRDSRQATLALQTRAARQAQDHLAGRMKEIEGDPQAAQLDSAPEVSAGLVTAIGQAETTRNTALAELDRLRHAVDTAYQTLTATLEQNRKLVEALPQSQTAPDTQEAAAAVSARK